MQVNPNLEIINSRAIKLNGSSSAIKISEQLHYFYSFYNFFST